MRVFGKVAIILYTAVQVICLFTAAEADSYDDPEKLGHNDLTDILRFSPKTVFYGGYTIAKGEILEGPVVVIAGALDILDGGLLEGEAWIVNGELIMNGRSRISGNLYLVNSERYSSHEAVIEGEVKLYKCECRLDDRMFEDEGTVSFLKQEDPLEVRTRFNLAEGDAGRVDYTFIRPGIIRENKLCKDPYVGGHAWISVPLKNKSGGFLGFDTELSIPLYGRGLELAFHGFKRTFTNDDWQLSGMENSLILVFTGDDFFDYWERRGVEIALHYRSGERLDVKGGVSFQKDVSLEAFPVASILFPKDKFRENPPIDEGHRLALMCNIKFDTRQEESWRENAWYCDLMVEKGLRDGPGDFSYTAFDVDIRRYNYLPWRMKLDLRAKLFSSFDRIPFQITRSLNGYGGVRGAKDFPFRTERGDRMMLFSAELRRKLPEVPVLRMLFSSWDFLVFTDIGLLTVAANATSPLAFLDTPFDEWKRTAGIGFSGESFLPYTGLYLAQDLDRNSFDPRLILRFQRSF